MKITAVIASRNDDYGLNLTHRAFYSLKSMSHVFDEVIYVDWNSPNNISLMEQFKLEGKNLNCNNVREIKITEQFIKSINLPNDAQPCCEVLARNIGIVRAKNDWIVSTNIDIVPSDFKYDNLSESNFYIGRKINVFDDFHLINFKDKSLSTSDIQMQLKENKHLFQKMPFLEQNNHANKIIQVVGCGDFQLGHKNLWNKIKGFEEKMIYRNHADSNVIIKAYYQDFNIKIIDEYDFYHLDHKNNNVFWKKDGNTKNNTWDEATIKYSITSNHDDWGFKTHNLE